MNSFDERNVRKDLLGKTSQPLPMFKNWKCADEVIAIDPHLAKVEALISDYMLYAHALEIKTGLTKISTVIPSRLYK